MPIEVTMPKLSPTMETGVITQWLVKVGDQVKEGDLLADIETDKATMQMKSYDDGIIAHIDHQAGDEVALGQRVLVLAKKGEDPKQVAAQLSAGAAGAAAEKKPALSAAGRGGATTAAENGQKTDQAATTTAESPGGRLRASPLARKMASSSQINLSQVRGSGPGGRIIRRDVEAYLAGAQAPTEGQSQAPAAPDAAPAPAVAAKPAPPPAERPAAPLPARPSFTPPLSRPSAFLTAGCARRLPSA